MVGPCVVCCSTRPPPDVASDFNKGHHRHHQHQHHHPVGGGSGGLLVEQDDHQAIVAFFLKKFLKYPLIGDGNVAEDLLSGSSNVKSHLVTFCWSCLPVIQEAQSLYKIIAELEEKMNILRRRVERRVVLSFHSETNRGTRSTNNTTSTSSSTTEGDKRSLFNAVRSKIYMRNADSFKNDMQEGGGGGGETTTTLGNKTTGGAFNRQNSEYAGGGNQQRQIGQQQQQQQQHQVTAAWPVVDPLAFLQMGGHTTGGSDQQGGGGGGGGGSDHDQQQHQTTTTTFTVPMSGLGGGGGGGTTTQYFPVVSISAATSDGNTTSWEATVGTGGTNTQQQQQTTIQIPSASSQHSFNKRESTGGRFSHESSGASKGSQKGRKSQSGKSSVGLRRSAQNVATPCDACGNMFSRKDSLARHQKLYCLKLPTSKAYQKMLKPSRLHPDDVGVDGSLNDKTVFIKTTDVDTSYTSEEDLLYTGGDQESVPNY